MPDLTQIGVKRGLFWACASEIIRRCRFWVMGPLLDTELTTCMGFVA
jgi:hypothetical protein